MTAAYYQHIVRIFQKDSITTYDAYVNKLQSMGKDEHHSVLCIQCEKMSITGLMSKWRGRLSSHYWCLENRFTDIMSKSINCIQCEKISITGLMPKSIHCIQCKKMSITGLMAKWIHFIQWGRLTLQYWCLENGITDIMRKSTHCIQCEKSSITGFDA